MTFRADRPLKTGPALGDRQPGPVAATMVVISAASGRAGTPSAAVATNSPHRLAPATSPIRTPNRRSPCGVSCPGLASEDTSPVSVPVR